MSKFYFIVVSFFFFILVRIQFRMNMDETKKKRGVFFLLHSFDRIKDIACVRYTDKTTKNIFLILLLIELDFINKTVSRFTVDGQFRISLHAASWL